MKYISALWQLDRSYYGTFKDVAELRQRLIDDPAIIGFAEMTPAVEYNRISVTKQDGHDYILAYRENPAP